VDAVVKGALIGNTGTEMGALVDKQVNTDTLESMVMKDMVMEDMVMEDMVVEDMVMEDMGMEDMVMENMVERTVVVAMRMEAALGNIGKIVVDTDGWVVVGSMVAVLVVEVLVVAGIQVAENYHCLLPQFHWTARIGLFHAAGHACTGIGAA
jgi:hypothetical protein